MERNVPNVTISSFLMAVNPAFWTWNHFLYIIVYCVITCFISYMQGILMSFKYLCLKLWLYVDYCMVFDSSYIVCTSESWNNLIKSFLNWSQNALSLHCCLWYLLFFFQITTRFLFVNISIWVHLRNSSHFFIFFHVLSDKWTKFIYS